MAANRAATEASGDASRAPLFSVVIPTFNAGPYIEATLASVAAQTYRDFELVVVDDGSNDDTLDRARMKVQHEQIPGQVVSRPEHAPKGVASARNHGVGIARGTWIAFLDADDLFEPTKLERCERVVAEFGSSPGAMHHAARYFDHETGEVLEASSPRPTTGDDLLVTLLERNCVTTSTTVVHRECLEGTQGFDMRLNGVEDYWLWIRIAKRWKWRYIAEPLTRYRLRAGSLMGQRPFEHYVTQFTALLAVAESSGELSAVEMATLRRSVLDGTIRFFAGKSARQGGLPSVLPGALQLARTGYPGSAASLIYRHFRAQALRWMVQSRTS